MFQYNAANTGHASSETGPTDPVTEQWRFRTEGDVVSSPAVVDSTVYVASADELYALNARDGAAQWRFPLERNFGVSSPAVVDNTVFATAGRDVVAVNASDGSEQWRFETEQGPRWSPTVAEGTLFIGNNRSMYALDVTDGTEL
jgi:outer membrane protein assembly factor BamB